MKKIITFVLAICLCGAVFGVSVGCTPRDEILKISNWGDYMSSDVYNGFAAWYKEKTGKKIKVEYNEFDTNEQVYTEIVRKKTDYDLICPSEYMTERMKNEGRLIRFDDETIDVINAAVNPDLKKLVLYDEGFEYTMPYIWGTMGIIYNTKSNNQDDEVMKNWSVLFDGSFGEKSVYMKDSVRDSYIIAALALNAEELLEIRDRNDGYNNDEYQEKLEGIFSTHETKTIEAVEKKLKDQYDYVKSYEIDSAKTELQLDNAGSGNFGMFWSCDAGFIMNVYENGSNFDLRYVVPEEGSNVWVDNFVIPQHAKNTEAANYFIQYLCEADIAYDCMDSAGGTTAIKAAADAYEQDLRDDAEALFKDTPDGFEEMYFEMLFPSTELLQRCTVMKDFGSKSKDFDDMWERVMLSN